MGIERKSEGEATLIRLTGSIGIAAAAELKRALADALREREPVAVSLAGATYLDVTAVQLLWAFGRDAARAGVEASLADRPAPQVARTLAEAGFEQFPEACLPEEVTGHGSSVTESR